PCPTTSLPSHYFCFLLMPCAGSRFQVGLHWGLYLLLPGTTLRMSSGIHSCLPSPSAFWAGQSTSRSCDCWYRTSTQKVSFSTPRWAALQKTALSASTLFVAPYYRKSPGWRSRLGKFSAAR